MHWELCKRLTFVHGGKLYVHKPGSFQEKEMNKFLWDFKIQMDEAFLGSDLILINKKKRTCSLMDFAIPEDNRVKNKSS